MEISVETTTDLERKMTIAVPSEEVDSAVNARLQEAARTIKMNGFRKGKVPFKVIKNRFGKGVRQEVLGELMNKSYFEALDQESIKPASQPKIEATQLDEGKDLEFTAIFEVYPEIELPDFAAISIEKLTAQVSEENIDKMIETLREQRHTWEAVDREAKPDDMLNIDYVGSIDGEEFSGGQAKGSSLVLGSGRMIEGFETGLEGCKAGDTRSLDLTFPDNYHNQELAGKEVKFEITVNKVSEKVIPELNEEFFDSFGIEEGGEEAFREEVAANMTREMETASRGKVKNQILEKILEVCDINTPKSLIDNEISSMRNQTLQQMGGANQQSLDPSILPDDLYVEQATRRVASGLILGEIINKQGLTADPVKVREAVEEIASTYESPEEVVNWYYGNREQLANVESSVLEDQVFDHIIDLAQVTENEVSYETVIQKEAPPAKSGKSAKKKADKEA